MSQFWENLSYDLLEMHLNQDGINAQILKQLFRERPEILEQMDFGNNVGLDGLDKHLYGKGQTKVVEVRTAKAHEVYTCIPCGGKIFKRRDNYRRHKRCSLHIRRLEQYENAKKLDAEKKAAVRMLSAANEA